MYMRLPRKDCVVSILHIYCDGTPLTPAQHQAKEAERANLWQQVSGLYQQLPPPMVTKVVHKN